MKRFAALYTALDATTSTNEKLEALMDTGKRDRIFPSEVGLEPSVVIRSEDTDEWEKIEWEAKAKADALAKSEAEAKTTCAPASPGTSMRVAPRVPAFFSAAMNQP